ncbi:glycosyltransferase family 2 protein [Kaistella palustris]|uniref:glycosyltransferase family 2 protein n=1 Tax=Kaistella palustris TaxID=493376 RepID=UPI000409CDE1|nr:glycosyltransferase family A protein [Kaistella palustris]
MISVIIPVYNAEESILRALNSVKNQTAAESFEIITVNDGSTDKSRQIIENFKAENKDLNLIIIDQQNAGVSAARNAAMKIAKGSHLAFLDADDEWLPEKTAKQMHIFHNAGFPVDFLATRRVNHVLKYPYTDFRNNLSAVTFRKLMFRNEAQPSTVILKREILDNTGYFDGGQKYGEDINYWLKISEKDKMYILNEELVFAGGGKRSFGISGLSANLKEMEKGFQKNLREMLRLNRISKTEYHCYRFFYQLKYVARVCRHKYLKQKGK